MRAYLDILRDVLERGERREDRTGVGTLSRFGYQIRYALADGFPAVTTKRLVWKSMVSELLWFVSGSDNINDLKAIYPHNRLWDGNYGDYLERLGVSANDGSMGRIYGAQWRRWADGVDQLQDAIDLIRNDPGSRRIIVNAWNASEVRAQDVALPPCHSFFQFYVAGGKLSLHMYQRSADLFLGVPLNIASLRPAATHGGTNYGPRARRVHSLARRRSHLPEPYRRRPAPTRARPLSLAANLRSKTAGNVRSTTSASTTSASSTIAPIRRSGRKWPSEQAAWLSHRVSGRSRPIRPP